ncbi:MAG: FixH family protein [Mariprofundales bacterium]|nr:FixH family protein [Mariprofundales bacterium]
MISEQLKHDLTNPWLRTILTIVGVTLTVNFIFIAYAYISPPNLVVKNYYERGKSYFHERHLRDVAAPTAWRLQLLTPKSIRAGRSSTIRLYVMDHQGAAISSGRVILHAYRPDDTDRDFTTTMQLKDRGTFAAPVIFPLPGHWDLIATIAANGHNFDTAQRIFVQR